MMAETILWDEREDATSLFRAQNWLGIIASIPDMYDEVSKEATTSVMEAEALRGVYDRDHGIGKWRRLAAALDRSDQLIEQLQGRATCTDGTANQIKLVTAMSDAAELQAAVASFVATLNAEAADLIGHMLRLARADAALNAGLAVRKNGRIVLLNDSASAP